MKSFSVFTHVSPNEVRFAGHAFEDGGFSVNENGDPLCDSRGNRVSKFSVSDIDERDADLLVACYCGDETPDRKGFTDWMAAEGVPAAVRVNVADSVCGEVSQ